MADRITTLSKRGLPPDWRFSPRINRGKTSPTGGVFDIMHLLYYKSSRKSQYPSVRKLSQIIMPAKKGFTLIELLVVLAIVAILSVVVILTLNPAELLKQARDSNRLSDLSTMKSAISLYLADVTSPNILYGFTTADCFVSVPLGTSITTSTRCGVFSATGLTLGNASNPRQATSTSLRDVDGTGWIPVQFTAISSGAPIGNLPVDPVNDATHYYAYAANATLQFQLDTFMESVKYTFMMSADGGLNNNAYETGTASGLSL